MSGFGKFLINQKVRLLDVINCNEGADFPDVDRVFTANK